MVKKCVLMKHGLNISGTSNNLIGNCCYTPSTRFNQYEIDSVACQACIDQENNNIKSYRMGVNEKYGIEQSHNGILVLDITPNLTCNLACKICNEFSSSSWAKLKQIPINKNYNTSPQNLFDIIKQYDLSHLKEINMSGGEPLLNNNLIKYISNLDKIVDFSKVNLRFSNNGTIQLNSNTINFMSQFKLVQARFSLDDVYEGHNYHRYPHRWEDWISNWETFLENMPVNTLPSINRTISILNINRLDELENWHKKYSYTKLGDPIELIDHFAFGDLNIFQISQDVKDHILTKFGEESLAWKYIKNVPISKDIKQCLDYITYLDNLHNQSFKEYDPIMYSILFKNR
jgi:hypothetical protein